MSECLFCRIAGHEIPVTPVFEDETTVVFPDINPQAPVHLLAIPKTHYRNAGTTPAEVFGTLMAAAATIGERILPGGYRLVLNTGQDAGQTVEHVHVHILGGRTLDWPPG